MEGSVLVYIISTGIGIISVLAVVQWRLNALEARMNKRAEQAREDRRTIHNGMGSIRVEMAELKGQLYGRGIINGNPGSGHKG